MVAVFGSRFVGIEVALNLELWSLKRRFLKHKDVLVLLILVLRRVDVYIDCVVCLDRALLLLMVGSVVLGPLFRT